MFKNYLSVAFRNLFRQKWYSLLNIFGLALGMTAAILIFSHIRVDMTWDRFHENSDRLVRLVEKQNFGEKELTDVAWIMSGIGPQIVQDFPDVEAQARMMMKRSTLYERGETEVYQKGSAYVDSTWFQLFSFDLKYGEKETALIRQDAIVLSQEAVATFFEKDENPMGQTLYMDGHREVTVTGVLEELPYSSHLDFDYLMPFHSIPLDQPEYNLNNWGSNNHACYLLLSNSYEGQLEELGKRITDLYHLHGSWEGLIFWVQPVVDMHLHSSHIELDGLNNGATDISSVYTLGSIGIFILLIAAINFINLSTARATRRAREVGMRKVSGASKGALMIQFLGESLLISFLSMLLAILLTFATKSFFESLTLRPLEINFLDGGFASLLLGLLTIGIGLLAGFYPALILSSLSPMKVLRGSGKGNVVSGGSWLRRSLVVFQFAISIVLLVSTGVIYKQVQFVKNYNLGFDGEQVIILPIRSDDVWTHKEVFQNRLNTTQGVVSVSSSSAIPSWGSGQSGIRPEGSDHSQMTEILTCDDKYQETLGLKMAHGRFFSRDFAGDFITQDDSVGNMVINETAARQFGFDEPLGRTVQAWGSTFTIVGVVKDYHHFSLHNEISPIAMIASENWNNVISIRFETQEVDHLIGDIETIWMDIYPELQFHYRFLDEQFGRSYRSDIRQANMMQTFSGLAIIIACLGLLGLAAYSTQRRTREIAIRKIMGATIPDILRLLTKEFSILVIVSSLIAWPVSWFIMEKWLENYAYRTQMPLWLFVLAGILALIIALLTTGSTALRASNKNPSDTLRQE